MFTLDTKYGDVKIYAQTIESEAVAQITKMANSPLGENANIRIMPDAHAGKGCTIGTTMRIVDKVCPNLVGVDIGCGVGLIRTNIDFKGREAELDRVIRHYIPFGRNVHSACQSYTFVDLYCWDKLSVDARNTALKSLGSLGGGNHYLEAYENGWLCVHSGSRNLGVQVAKYYQNLAAARFKENRSRDYTAELQTVPPQEREEWIRKHKPQPVDSELLWLEGDDMQAYLHDMDLVQKFAAANRAAMLNTIMEQMNGKIEQQITSVHNYIDVEHMFLRKGAISAQYGETIVIPLNMRDGVLVCRGKGNADWNYSAPHGAGRLYSRSKAKENFTVEQYAEAMSGIYTTCVNSATLDEAPFAYKDAEEIKRCIEPTCEILFQLKPIYNFKADA